MTSTNSFANESMFTVECSDWEWRNDDNTAFLPSIWFQNHRLLSFHWLPIIRKAYVAFQNIYKNYNDRQIPNMTRQQNGDHNRKTFRCRMTRYIVRSGGRLLNAHQLSHKKHRIYPKQSRNSSIQLKSHGRNTNQSISSEAYEDFRFGHKFSLMVVGPSMCWSAPLFSHMRKSGFLTSRLNSNRLFAGIKLTPLMTL